MEDNYRIRSIVSKGDGSIIVTYRDGREKIIKVGESLDLVDGGTVKVERTDKGTKSTITGLGFTRMTTKKS